MTERSESAEVPFWENADETEALRRYRTLVNTIDDGIYQLDREGRFVAVNDVITELTGYDREELLGERVSVLLDVDDVATVEREIRRRLGESEGQRDTFEFDVGTAYGDRIPCELRLNLLVDDGQFRGSIGVVRDVSKRKRTERELGERERQLERERDLTEEVLDASPVGVMVLDADGTVTRVNDRATELLGISDDELGSYDPGDRPTYDENGRHVPVDEHPFAEALATGDPVYDRVLQVERRDGERRWLSVSAEPLLDDDGEVDRVVTTGEDVTDIKRRERELESELTEVFGRVTDAFYALDADWQFNHVNDRAEALIDYRGEGLVGEDFWEVFEWAEDSTLGEEYREAMATQEPTSFEFYYPEPLEAWYEVHAYPSETGLSVYFRDVTDRKRRERALEESEQRYRTLVENFPNGAVALVEEGEDGGLRYVTFGGTPEGESDVTRADLEGELLREGLPEELADVVVPHYEAALGGETGTFETRIDEKVYQFHFLPVRDDDGDVFAALGMSQDVTAREEYRRQLEESERRYRTLAENFPNGSVTLFDHDLVYTLAAGRGFEDIRLDPDELVGQHFRDVWDEAIADALEPAFEAALDGEERSVELGYEGREWLLHAVPITDQRGDVFAGMTVVQDVTERKEREQKLEATVEKLEESNERLESFASMLAHELRNPVTIGQIYTQQLQTERAPEAAEYVTEAFDRIEDMIDVMLVLTRGRDAVGESGSLALADVARDAWEGVDAPDAALETDLDGVVEADETYLRHLFRNLFENAVQHGDAGRVRVGELPTGFYVADDGGGIPADERETVFEAGFTTAADEGGTGLGLAFVRELAEVYGWSYAATESETGGARIEFRDVEFAARE